MTATECSKCAERLPSRVRAVQPSSALEHHLGPAGVDHRLDRQHHARHQPRAPARLPEVRHLRVLVQLRADPVADELPHHREAVRLDVRLHRVPDVGDAVARPGLRDAEVQRLARHLQQPLAPRR